MPKVNRRGGAKCGRGRPRAGAETGPTVLKSVRLPPTIWKELEERARAEGVAVHALVRKAILALLRRVAQARLHPKAKKPTLVGFSSSGAPGRMNLELRWLAERALAEASMIA